MKSSHNIYWQRESLTSPARGVENDTILDRGETRSGTSAPEKCGRTFRVRLFYLAHCARLTCARAGHDTTVLAMVALEGGRLASSCRGGDIKIWDVEAGCEVHALEGHTTRVGALAALDGQLASGSADTKVISEPLPHRTHSRSWGDPGPALNDRWQIMLWDPACAPRRQTECWRVTKRRCSHW